MAGKIMIDEEARRRALAAYLKTKMTETGITFAELARRLQDEGAEPIDRVVLSNKVRRGSFSAAFLLDVLGALGIDPEWTKEVEQYLPNP